MQRILLPPKKALRQYFHNTTTLVIEATTCHLQQQQLQEQKQHKQQQHQLQQKHQLQHQLQQQQLQQQQQQKQQLQQQNYIAYANYVNKMKMCGNFSVNRNFGTSAIIKNNKNSKKNNKNSTDEKNNKDSKNKDPKYTDEKNEKGQNNYVGNCYIDEKNAASAENNNDNNNNNNKDTQPNNKNNNENDDGIKTNAHLDPNNNKNNKISAPNKTPHPPNNNKEVSFDEFGAWDHRIDLPLLMDASIKQGVPVPLVLPSDVGTSSIMGKRPYQEDRYVVETLSNNILCVGVFDGHGGNECSQYCYTHLKSVLSEELTRHHDLQTVLHNTFHTLHTRYTHWVHTYKQGYRSGTTACVSLLRGGVELALAHVGDSRAILCRSGGQPVNLTADHCPSLIAEKNRIVSSGGTVTTDNIGRHLVNDTLSMSRSLGDLHLKPYGVIPLPDTRTLRVKHGKDAFLLHITDGINFVLTSEEACDIINQTEDPHQAAIVLTEQAQSMASEDNITAVVVPFGSWGKYTKSASMFYSFGIGRDMNKSSRFG